MHNWIADFCVTKHRKHCGKCLAHVSADFRLLPSVFRLCLLFFAAMTLVAPAVVHGQSADLVQTLGKAPLRGNIQSMSSTEITISVAGRDRSVPVNELANVSFRGEPSELVVARQLVASGNYESALEKIEQIDAGAIRRTEVKQDVEFFRVKAASGMALAGSTDPGSAVRQLRRFLKGAPDNYHYYEAVDLLGQLALAIGDYKRAVTYFGRLAKAPWKDYKLQARVLQGKAKMLQGKYDDALEIFRQVSESSVTGIVADRQKSLARIGMAICYAETGQADQGIGLAEEILKKTGPDKTELNAKAYNALGVCYLKLDKPKDALLAFLHTDLLYAGQRDAHAEALFHLTQLWKQMDKNGRAQSSGDTLKKRYANSPWAKRL